MIQAAEAVKKDDPDRLLRQFDELTPLTNTLMRVKKGDKYGVFSRETDAFVVPIECDAILPHTDTIAVIEKGGKRGLFSEKSFRRVVPVEYESVQLISTFYAKVGDGKRFGVYDIRNPVIVVPIDYEDVTVEDDALVVSYSGHQGIFDVKTKSIQWK